MKIVWTRAATDDLRRLEEYIATDSIFYARFFVEKILSMTRNLEIFPRCGRMVPEVDTDEIRELIAPPYRIIYQIQSNRIRILTVVHSSRKVELNK